VHLVVLIAPLKLDRMLEMAPRQRTDPVRAEELPFVEHHGEDPSQALLVDQRHQAPALRAYIRGMTEPWQDVGEALDELLNALQHPGIALDKFAFEHGGGAQRQQPDE
jgi:hypothetical protein